jgi:hypothetical protein
MLNASARAAFDNNNYKSAIGNLVKLWRILCFPIVRLIPLSDTFIQFLFSGLFPLSLIISIFIYFFQSAAIIMGDSSELAQAAVLEPILLSKPVSTLFSNTPFMEQIRVDFDPSLWRTQIPEGGDPSTFLLIIYAIYMFYNYLDMNQADYELFWTYKKEFHDWSPEWFRRLDAKLRSALK